MKPKKIKFLIGYSQSAHEKSNSIRLTNTEDKEAMAKHVIDRGNHINGSMLSESAAIGSNKPKFAVNPFSGRGKILAHLARKKHVAK